MLWKNLVLDRSLGGLQSYDKSFNYKIRFKSFQWFNLEENWGNKDIDKDGGSAYDGMKYDFSKKITFIDILIQHMNHNKQNLFKN